MENLENDKEEGFSYFISTPAGESVNRTMYKMAQNPANWLRKGLQHRRDAQIMYEANKAMRDKIMLELEGRNFNFGRFFRHDLTGTIGEILDENHNAYLPDFDGFYNFAHLSFENILKGIWLDKNVDLIGFDQLPSQIQTHDLGKLANYTSVKINKIQKDALERVYNMYMGYGRYPINTKVKIERGTEGIDFGDRSFETVCFDLLSNEYEDDNEIFSSIFKKLSKDIQRIFKSEGKYIEKMFMIKAEMASN